MSKRADQIRASAASLADLEEEFQTPAPKQYPPVVKPPANSQPSAAEKPAVLTPPPAPVAEAPVVEAPPAEVATIANTEERRRRRGGKQTVKAEGQRLPPSRVGKVPINVWTTEEKRRALKIHAVSEGATIDELMTEALDDLLKKRRIRVG